MNDNKQPLWLQVTAVVAFLSSAYFYSQLSKSDFVLTGVAGGEVDGGDETGSEYIVNMKSP